VAIAYFDCFAGAAGDMIVGSLIDAGADLVALKAQLAGLQVGGYEMSADRVMRGGLAGTKFDVRLDEASQPRRHLSDIIEAIAGAGLPARAAERASRVFRRLAEAEAQVHNVAVEEVHFHEVGAVDSIVDVVGACLAMEQLGIDRVFCSPIPTGGGTVDTSHGLLPVPAPATARLLVGAAIADAHIEGEATTPTAAALLTELAEAYGPVPAMRLEAIGWGAGTRDTPAGPNLLRVFVGQADADGQTDSVVEISANLDDCTGEVLGATVEKLLAAGCLDAWVTPAYMKKSRPAWVLSVLCDPSDAARAEDIIFAETTTFGLRRRTASRSKLDREHVTVSTRFGPIRIKVGRRAGRELTASPEFADCRAAADAHHASLRDVQEAARRAYEDRKEP
jgi:hypothetical protein